MINGERKEKDVVTSFDGCSLASDLPCDKTKREEGGVRGRLFVWSKLQRCLVVFFSFSQRRESPVFYDFVSLIYEIVVFFFCHQCLKKFPGKKDDKGSYDCGRQVSIVNSGRCVWGMHPAHLCVGMQVKARGRVSWNCWC